MKSGRKVRNDVLLHLASIYKSPTKYLLILALESLTWLNRTVFRFLVVCRNMSMLSARLVSTFDQEYNYASVALYFHLEFVKSVVILYLRIELKWKKWITFFFVFKI